MEADFREVINAGRYPGAPRLRLAARICVVAKIARTVSRPSLLPVQDSAFPFDSRRTIALALRASISPAAQ